jgi:hypothetical protein
VALRQWLPLLCGMPLAGLMVWSLTPAEPPCAYVLGQTGAGTVAIPARVVFVPAEEAGVQPVRVHLDEAERTLLGYSPRTPGSDTGPEATRIFVSGPAPGATPAQESPWTCSSEGVRTPAIPVRVPIPVFEHPDTVVAVTSITLHLSNKPVTRPGHVMALAGGGLLVLPQPGLPASLAEGDLAGPFITVDLGDSVRTARYLPPLRDRARENP